MKKLRKSEKISKKIISTIQYGVSVENTASLLTKGWGGRYLESIHYHEIGKR